MAATGAGRRLPYSSGNFGVSRVAYDWVDVSRPETAINDPSAHRELMVYLWYPTNKNHVPTTRAQYLPGADKIAKDGSAKDTTEFWGDSWPEVASSQIVTETSEHAPIASGTEKFPLILFAPGLGLSSTTYTSTIQELVSHGYVIASIEPTYEVGAVVFPDGRVITERPEATGRGPSPPNESREQFLKRLAGWPTLGAITKPRLPHPLRFSKGGHHGCRHLETTPLTSSSQLGHRENLVVQSVGFPSFRKERERMGQPQLVVAQKGRPAPCGRSMGFGADETLLTKSANAGRRG